LKVSILSFVLLSFLLCSNLAGAVSWVEVTRFTGSGDYITDYFTCNHAEWRLDWNYTPAPSYPTLASFAIYIYPKNENVSIFSVLQTGNTTTSGTTYAHDQQGEFYLKFLAANLQSYAVIISQDVDSVPEFSPIVLLLMFAAGIVVAMILGKKARTSVL